FVWQANPVTACPVCEQTDGLTAQLGNPSLEATSEIDDLVSNSSLTAKYNVHLDRESAFEMLNSKLDKVEKEQEKTTLPGPKPRTTTRTTQDESLIEELSKNTMVRQIGRTIFRELTRGILGSFSRRR
ncbi:helicase HerA-like domain-containing protein, partial [uncultured Algoriphagus sp.]|uniref:helicase HerA-like domain-containing protein n=1 Tax=uncultured Algoriphagus sp. TaxID=417365 RepID=UPI002599EB6B